MLLALRNEVVTVGQLFSYYPSAWRGSVESEGVGFRFL